MKNKDAYIFLEEFIKDCLDGDINNLKNFCFFFLKKSNEFIHYKDIKNELKLKYGNNKDENEDPDNMEIVKAIFLIIYENIIPKFNDTNSIGAPPEEEIRYRGDTINTFNTLFNDGEVNGKFAFEEEYKDDSKFIEDIKLFRQKAFTIGNMILLPNHTIEFSPKNFQSLNTYRGTISGWNDYFEKFLIELWNIINNRGNIDSRLTMLVEKNNFYFDTYKKNFKKFIKHNYLENYINENNYPKQELAPYYHYNKNLYDTKDEFISFGKLYIKTSIERIEERTDKIIEALKQNKNALL